MPLHRNHLYTVHFPAENTDAQLMTDTVGHAELPLMSLFDPSDTVLLI